MNTDKLNKKLTSKFGGRVFAKIENGAIVVSGELDRWEDVVAACNEAVDKKSGMHVVNNISFTGGEIKKMRLPSFSDSALDCRQPDVLIIGGGISGASIARELSKWKLDILLVEKEADFAMQASGRNDGEVHPGVDLSKGTLKHKYVRAGNAMYDKICEELNVPFERVGQYVGFTDMKLKPLIELYAMKKKKADGISDTVVLSAAEIRKNEPNLNPEFKFALCNPSSGSVCPYGLTIAYAENAVQNGVTAALNTAVISMDCRDGKIFSVLTNRGIIYPRLVISAAGVFADDVAEMAGDKFFSIHPRRGTNSILDKKAGKYMHTISSIKQLTLSKSHTKGGGVLHTAHGNLLIGPDAVETYEKENYATNPDSIKRVFDKQRKTMPCLTERDIITYFTGVRAPTFEEDFIIEKGHSVKNLIHCAGIQSPGLTTAPAVALDIEKMAVEMLSQEMKVEKNPKFNPIRKGVPVLREMSDEERDELIKKNPDYGVIVCRCEEISRGEILDALASPVCVPTVDGIKKRIRPGMGRCQGGFCMPLVTKIIAEQQGIDISDVVKSSADSRILFGETKGAAR